MTHRVLHHYRNYAKLNKIWFQISSMNIHAHAAVLPTLTSSTEGRC